MKVLEIIKACNNVNLMLLVVQKLHSFKKQIYLILSLKLLSGIFRNEFNFVTKNNLDVITFFFFFYINIFWFTFFFNRFYRLTDRLTFLVYTSQHIFRLTDRHFCFRFTFFVNNSGLNLHLCYLTELIFFVYIFTKSLT